MMGAQHGQPFHDHALQLVELGYPVLPIVPKQKNPLIPHWDTVDVEPGQVQQWLGQYPDANIGIRLGADTGNGYLVAIDLDVRDSDLLQEWQSRFQSTLSLLPAREGEPPKTLLLAQCDEPTRKLQSSVWEDPRGQTHKVEVLADGQQFVAFGTHPSGSPFRWVSEHTPLNTPARQLPVLTLEQLQQTIQLFEELASLRRWKQKGQSRAEIIPIDSQYREPMGVDPEKVRSALAYMDADDYDTWIDVGQALYHEFNGEDTGFNLWNEWSSRSEKYPGPEGLRKKWHSFRGMGARTTITIRSIFYRAKQNWQAQQRGEQQRKANELVPKPVGRIDPSNIPARRWILGHRLMSHYLTATFAPGGVAKSVLSLTSAVAIATGREMTGEAVHQTGRVWIINNEDDEAELHRRLAGIYAAHGIPDSELDGRLFVNSGYGEPVLVASEENGMVVNHPNVEAIINGIQACGIDYLVLDPFVSAHNSDENSNTAVNRVADAFKHIAAETGCAVEIIHHTRKGNMGDPGWHIGDAEAGRGASALKDAARIVTTLARISQDKSRELGIPWEEGRRLVRMDLGKGNFSLPDEEATWFRLESVQLPNGDTVGVPQSYDIHEATHVHGIDHVQAKDHEIQQWRIDIVEAMDQDMLPVKWLQARLEWIWEVGSQQAWRRMIAASPLGGDQAVTVATQETVWQLWMQETEGGSQNALTVCRSDVDAPWLL